MEIYNVNIDGVTPPTIDNTIYKKDVGRYTSHIRKLGEDSKDGLRCNACGCPVFIRRNALNEDDSYHFVHNSRKNIQSNLSLDYIFLVKDCPFYTDQSSFVNAADIYVGETILHKTLKHIISKKLESYSDVFDVSIEKRITNPVDGRFRTPDVIATVQGVPTAYELQLSWLPMKTVVARTRFYSNLGMRVVWVYIDNIRFINEKGDEQIGRHTSQGMINDLDVAAYHHEFNAPATQTFLNLTDITHIQYQSVNDTDVNGLLLNVTSDEYVKDIKTGKLELTGECRVKNGIELNQLEFIESCPLPVYGFAQTTKNAIVSRDLNCLNKQKEELKNEIFALKISIEEQKRVVDDEKFKLHAAKVNNEKIRMFIGKRRTPLIDKKLSQLEYLINKIEKHKEERNSLIKWNSSINYEVRNYGHDYYNQNIRMCDEIMKVKRKYIGIVMSFEAVCNLRLTVKWYRNDNEHQKSEINRYIGKINNERELTHKLKGAISYKEVEYKQVKERYSEFFNLQTIREFNVSSLTNISFDLATKFRSTDINDLINLDYETLVIDVLGTTVDEYFISDFADFIKKYELHDIFNVTVNKWSGLRTISINGEKLGSSFKRGNGTAY